MRRKGRIWEKVEGDEGLGGGGRREERSGEGRGIQEGDLEEERNSEEGIEGKKE